MGQLRVIMKHWKVAYTIIIFLIVFVCLFFANERVEAQTDTFSSIVINSGESFGQSLTSLHRGLNEIGITVSSNNSVSGILQLQLFQNISPKLLVLTKEYPVKVNSSQFFSLTFETQEDSYLQDYHIVFVWDGSGPIEIQTNSPESYGQGSLYLNNKPVSAQLVFNLSYDHCEAVLGLGSQALTWIWQLILTTLILVIPGWAFLEYSWSGWKRYIFPIKLALAIGSSYALYPLLFLLTDLFNFHPGKGFFVWTMVGFCAFILLFQFLSNSKNKHLSTTQENQGFHFTLELWHNLAFLVIIGIIFLVKFWAIRTLDTPMWGDSYQHTVITQLMTNAGGLFDSWQPYVPYETFTVHFGFHAISTVFSWISGLNASRSVLWIGQVSNALSALCLYPITYKVSGGKKWAGIISVVVAGLVTIYPNYFVNWGRYAQLSGQVLLPVAGFLLIESLYSEKTNLGQLIIVSITLSGMALCYYRMPFFLILWLPLIIGEMFHWLKSKDNKISTLLFRATIVLLGMVVLLIPLFLRISGGTLAESVGLMDSPKLDEAVTTFLLNLKSTQNYYSQPLLILTLVSILTSIFTNQWRIFSVLVGMVLLHAFKIGTVVNLPFSNYIDNFSIQIMLYIGLSTILSYALALVADNLDQVHSTITPILLVAISLMFAFEAKNVTDNIYEMVTRSDLRAFSWINQHTNVDDLFLVNGFTIYDNTSGVGSDGGWWISLLTDRENTMPPQYAVLNEKPETPGYTVWTVDVINYFEQHSPSSQEGIRAMCKWGIDYIYIGQKQGSINDSTPLLAWKDWKQVFALNLVYSEDQVRIYQLDQQFCTAGW